ncbi:MAG: Rv2231c family pyridoxal phosphate-dependent protein CobC [Actinobacteria bacterium]|nr:Rv2231c family pyridoxal phosphate-dependent protein CobC [Actinomycetota bacterium]
MTRILVIGPTRSGKSAVAERLAAATGHPVVVITPGLVTDAEMAERIAAHRRRRPAGWTTLETADLAAAVMSSAPDDTVLVDALDTWLTRRMGEAGLWTEAAVAPLGAAGRAARDTVLAELTGFWDTAGARPGTTLVVAGQPGWGPTPTDAATRRYLDLHGDAGQRLSAGADRVVLAVAGRAVEVADRLPAALDPPTRSGPPGAVMQREADRGVVVAGRRPPPDDMAGRLREHGDRQVPAGTVDLAVNVVPGPPRWLRDRLEAALDRADAYPDDTQARAAAAARHHRPLEECLVLDGAAEAIWLLAAALRPRLAACVHPSFTEPEAALRACGHPVVRVQRDPAAGWALDPATVPADADLVVVGRPDNPTGVVDPVATVEALARPGRILVVDEAFAELLDDAAGVADRRDLPGVVAVRSLTKLWGLAGLRVGYLVADAELVAQLAAHRQPWPVNALALEAVVACVEADEHRRGRARAVAAERDHLLAALRSVPGLTVWPSAANFVLVHAPGHPDLRRRLLDRGLAVRRGDTFPGLGPDHVRIAVRDRATTDRLVTALSDAVAARPSASRS